MTLILKGGLAICILLSSFTINSEIEKPSSQRIVTLSPHLTELVFALGKGDQVVGVSDYSDYPAEALSLPRVADFQGADIGAILRLKPSHVLVWKEGNKSSDIAKLQASGLKVYLSTVRNVDELGSEIMAIGDFISAPEKALNVTKQIEDLIRKQRAKDYPPLSVLYYMSLQPLYGLGSDKWLNSLLALCGLSNVYADMAMPYSQLALSDVLRQQVKVIIAADNLSPEQHEAFWSTHAKVFQAKLITVNPDAMHRFTPRAVYETSQLCNALHERADDVD